MKISTLITFLQYAWAAFLGFLTTWMHFPFPLSLAVWIVSALVVTLVAAHLRLKFKDR